MTRHENPRRRPMPLRLAPSTIERLDDIAETAGIARAELIRQAIGHALTCPDFKPTKT